VPQSVAVTDECQLVDLTIAYFFSKIKFFLHFFPTYFFRQKRSYPVSSSSHAIQVSIIQSCHPVSISISISISILVSIIQSCHPGISILVIQHTLRSIGLLCHRMDSTGCVVCGHPARKKKEDRRSILFSSHFYKNSIYLIFEKVTHGFAIGDPVSVCT